jgi:hypothetical protein
MTAEQAARSVATVATAMTLSLFTTIAAFAAVSVAPLKWDGTFCTANACAAGMMLLPDTPRYSVASLAKQKS